MAFRADLQAIRNLIADPAHDVFARIPQERGQTTLREAWWSPITMPIIWANW